MTAQKKHDFKCSQEGIWTIDGERIVLMDFCDAIIASGVGAVEKISESAKSLASLQYQKEDPSADQIWNINPGGWTFWFRVDTTNERNVPELWLLSSKKTKYSLDPEFEASKEIVSSTGNAFPKKASKWCLVYDGKTSR